MDLIKGIVLHKSNGFVECKMRSLEEWYSWFCHVWCVGDLHMAGSTSRDSGLKETVTLKWCTPRTNSVGEWNSGRSFLLSFIWQICDFILFFTELHYCTGAYRISPLDVNSRPSSCLTNFLLNGVCAQSFVPPFFRIEYTVCFTFGNWDRESEIKLN